MRAVGIDLGQKRIGVAVSDSEGKVSTPHDILKKTDDNAELLEVIKKLKAEILVVGMPFSMDGTEGEMAKKVKQEIRKLEKNLEIPIVVQDERLSSKEAAIYLSEAGLNQRKQRGKVDKIAASIILQAWLDKTKENMFKNE